MKKTLAEIAEIYKPLLYGMYLSFDFVKDKFYCNYNFGLVFELGSREELDDDNCKELIVSRIDNARRNSKQKL